MIKEITYKQHNIEPLQLTCNDLMCLSTFLNEYMFEHENNELSIVLKHNRIYINVSVNFKDYGLYELIEYKREITSNTPYKVVAVNKESKSILTLRLNW